MWHDWWSFEFFWSGVKTSWDFHTHSQQSRVFLRVELKIKQLCGGGHRSTTVPQITTLYNWAQKLLTSHARYQTGGLCFHGDEPTSLWPCGFFPPNPDSWTVWTISYLVISFMRNLQHHVIEEAAAPVLFTPNTFLSARLRLGAVSVIEFIFFPPWNIERLLVARRRQMSRRGALCRAFGLISLAGGNIWLWPFLFHCNWRLFSFFLLRNVTEGLWPNVLSWARVSVERMRKWLSAWQISCR